MWNMNAPQGRRPIPYAIVTKRPDYVARFRMHQLLNFRWICSRGYGVMGVLSWRGLVIPKFSAPFSGKTVRQTPKVLEVQERARGPQSPCHVWWGSDFTRRQGGQTLSFLSVCLFLCLFVTLSFERQRLCDRFRHEGFEVHRNDFDAVR